MSAPVSRLLSPPPWDIIDRLPRGYFPRPFSKQESMKNLSVLTTAFAVGVSCVGATAQPISRQPATALPERNEAVADPFPGKAMDDIQQSWISRPDAAIASPYAGIIAKYAYRYGLPVRLAHAVIRIESNYKPYALGKAGEVGLMQIKPSTAEMMGYEGSVTGLFDPETNIKYGLKYLAKARDLGGGDTCGTILRYNAGHAAKRMNPTSRAYCRKVQLHLARL